MKKQLNALWSFLSTSHLSVKGPSHHVFENKARVLELMAQGSNIDSLNWLFDHLFSSDQEIALQAARSISSILKKWTKDIKWRVSNNDIFYLSMDPIAVRSFLKFEEYEQKHLPRNDEAYLAQHVS